MGRAPGQVTAVARGQGASLGAWMARYGPALRTYFRKKVGVNDADDLVQEVFANLQERGRVDDIEHANRYLFRVAANVLARRNQVRTWDWADSTGLEELELFDDLSPERILVAKQSVAKLMDVLQELPPRVQEAFIMHRFEDMTYREIAQRMGIQPKSVEALIIRALARITTIMERAP